MASNEQSKGFSKTFNFTLSLPGLPPGGKKKINDLAEIRISLKEAGTNSPGMPHEVTMEDIQAEASRIAAITDDQNRMAEIRNLLQFLVVVATDAQSFGDWAVAAEAAIAGFPKQLAALKQSGIQIDSISPHGKDSPDI